MVVCQRPERLVTPALLELDSITKRFGNLLALDDVSFHVSRGSFHALLGENGAGKTTLAAVAYGLLRPERGRVSVDGAVKDFRSPTGALSAGIGMVQQHFSLVPSMSVVENVALGARGPFQPALVRDQVLRLAESTGLPVDPDARVDSLNIGAQQRVEILKALARNARVLILDEPTAVLSPQEGAELLRWIRAFCVAGRAAVLITHKLEEARAYSDVVTVLRGGRVALTAATESVTTGQLVRAMLGEELATPTRSPREAHVGTVVVCSDHLALRDERGIERIRDASFEIRSAEIVGVAGVEGAGHRELLRALAGRLRPASGALRLPERIGYVPEDRLGDALISSFDLRENLALHDARRGRGLMRWERFEMDAASLLRTFDVRAASTRVTVDTLSGGNQQKFVFARELHDEPELLVAINPTRGLDVRASQALIARLSAARDAGMAVIVHSSDVDELLMFCDRILVVHAARVSELPRDRDLIGRALVGAA